MIPPIEFLSPFLLNIITEYYSFYNKIIFRDDKLTKYPDITEIEQLCLLLDSNINIIDANFIGKVIENLNEAELIKVTRLRYKELGINLKTNWRSPITIQTESSKITFRRYMLSPISADDKAKLLGLENKKNIYPIDQVLGISNLPFKMTVEAMLKVSKYGQELRSYKKASQLLAEMSGIKLDPVTIISVTNHIGKIAYDHDHKKAIEIYDLLEKGKLQFPTKKKDSTLFIQVDGAMVNTRKKEKTNNKDQESTWHENKLGLVYSSDNVKVTGRILKNGKKEEDRHQILIKEYTTYIGEVTEFKK
jgi:hypothetical protein